MMPFELPDPTATTVKLTPLAVACVLLRRTADELMAIQRVIRHRRNSGWALEHLTDRRSLLRVRLHECHERIRVLCGETSV